MHCRALYIYMSTYLHYTSLYVKYRQKNRQTELQNYKITTAIIIYLSFDLNKLPLFKSNDLINRDRRWRVIMRFERNARFKVSCQEKQVLTRVNQESIS